MAEATNTQFERIKQVFSTDKIPAVSESSIRIYCDYIKKNLICPCLLTGIESMGFFSWEARFSFGYGNKNEYKQLRQQKGSFQDIYELKEFDAITDAWDIQINVQRIPYHKKFTVPLSELQSKDETSPNHQLLKDYSVWRVNW